MERLSKEVEHAMRVAKRSRKQKRMRACAETESPKKNSSKSQCWAVGGTRICV